MQILFAINLPDGIVLEEELARQALDDGTSPANETYLFGWLRWRHEGQPDLDYNDDLGFLMPNLLRAVATLRDQGSAEIRMVSYFCHLSLVTNGDVVELRQKDFEMDNQEVARYPKDALLGALADCGRRFAAYAQTLADIDPQWTGLSELMAKLTAPD